MHIGDIGSPEFSWRRLGALLRALPADSATRVSLAGSEASLWTVSDYLLANVVDALQGANWQRGGGKSARPRPLDRPGSRDKKTIGGGGTMTHAEFDEWYARDRREVTPP